MFCFKLRGLEPAFGRGLGLGVRFKVLGTIPALSVTPAAPRQHATQPPAPTRPYHWGGGGLGKPDA